MGSLQLPLEERADEVLRKIFPDHFNPIVSDHPNPNFSGHPNPILFGNQQGQESHLQTILPPLSPSGNSLDDVSGPSGGLFCAKKKRPCGCNFGGGKKHKKCPNFKVEPCPDPVCPNVSKLQSLNYSKE